MMKKALGAMVIWTCASVCFGSSVSGVGAVLHPLNKYDSDVTNGLTTFANGPRLISSGGGIWFLESNADRIAFFKDNVIQEWPIRAKSYPNPFRSVGASPADFELDGSTVWFIENGSSGVELNESVFARLDTVTNELTEWILPISKPAGFYRDPDGHTVWVPMSQGSLLRFDLVTLGAVAFRSPDSLAYSGLTVGADGLFYLTDFGNNRVVRIDPATVEETAWQTFDPTNIRELPTQPTLGPGGVLYLAEATDGGAIGRLNFSTGLFERFAGGHLASPTHFLLEGGVIYVVETDPLGGDGRVVIVDEAVAAAPTLTLTPKTASLASLPATAVKVRTLTVVPITFQSSNSDPDGAVVATSPVAGVTRFTLPHGTNFGSTTTYSLTVVDGKVVVGLRGALAEFTLLPPADATDLFVPVALGSGNGSLRTDLTVQNSSGSASLFGVTFYDSPIPPPPSALLSVPAGQTNRFANALGTTFLSAGDGLGALRISPPVADAGKYQAISRTYAAPTDGSTYGFVLPALPYSDGIAPASTPKALLLGDDPAETSIFGLYSPSGATGSVVLHGPDGAVRGRYAFFLPSNNRQEFNPAFSAFGAAAEAGDWLTFEVSSGTIFPYVTLYQPTQDVAAELPVSAASDFVFPLIGSGTTAYGLNYVADVRLANSDVAAPSAVTAALYPVDAALAPRLFSLTLPPGGTGTIAFDASDPVAGALLVRASSPVFAGVRFASRTATGDYAGFASPLSAPSSGRFLVSGDPNLRDNLLLFNRGSAGNVTIRGFDELGNSTATLVLAVGDHLPLVVPQGALGLSGTGRIEVIGGPGTLVYAWLSMAEIHNGDPDVEPPFSFPLLP
jgi:hypothetical protein